MELKTKIGEVLLILIIVFIWNKYIVTFIIKKIISFHKNYNKSNITKQPFKFLIANELGIIKFAQYFYWFGTLIVCYGKLKE